MTELRQRMIACLPHQGLAERAQKMSVRAVRQLAEHSHQAPDLITEEALRQYFLYIKHVKKYSRSASTMALSGIQFCCAHTLHSDWTTLRLVRAPREQQLSVILSFAEVRRMLGGVRLLGYRVCLSTISSCGRRLQEGMPLQVADSDSARLVIHGRRGKGGQDRVSPCHHARFLWQMGLLSVMEAL